MTPEQAKWDGFFDTLQKLASQEQVVLPLTEGNAPYPPAQIAEQAAQAADQPSDGRGMRYLKAVGAGLAGTGLGFLVGAGAGKLYEHLSGYHPVTNPGPIPPQAFAAGMAALGGLGSLAHNLYNDRVKRELHDHHPPARNLRKPLSTRNQHATDSTVACAALVSVVFARPICHRSCGVFSLVRGRRHRDCDPGREHPASKQHRCTSCNQPDARPV
mgnify:FL=1